MQQPDILPTDILGGADETGPDERARGRAALGRAGRAQPTHHVVLHPLPALPPEGRGVSD